MILILKRISYHKTCRLVLFHTLKMHCTNNAATRKSRGPAIRWVHLQDISHDSVGWSLSYAISPHSFENEEMNKTNGWRKGKVWLVMLNVVLEHISIVTCGLGTWMCCIADFEHITIRFVSFRSFIWNVRMIVLCERSLVIMQYLGHARASYLY